MLRSFTLSGSEAVVRWGYHSAAVLGPWTLTADTTGGTVTAKVTTADGFKLAQPDLIFRVPRQTGSWDYPIHSLLVADGTLTARVSMQE
jgi:hypothetical protein